MADNKLIWTELRRALATRAGVSQKEANLFLNAFNTQLIEALKQDKQVKINGLGVFKLQAVAPRKSVNIATGEEIIINGYSKLAFVPEAGVKELIEKAGTVGATAQALNLTDDPIQKLGAQADEIVGILGELGQSPNEEAVEAPAPEPEPAEEPVATPEVTEEPIVAEEPAAEPEPIAAPEPVIAPEPEPVVEQPQPVVEEPKAAEPIFVPGMSVQVEQPQPVKPKKRYHFVRDTLICVVILLLLLLVGYFFLREQIGGWIEKWMQPKPQTEQVEQVETVEAEEPVEATDDITTEETTEEPIQTEERISEDELTQEQILAEFMQASGDDEWVYEPTSAYPRLITVERIREGSRLAWISKRYYGSKIYWPYLYDANKDHISNPNDIEVGTPIRIPKLTNVQLDTTNTSTIATIERLHAEAEAAMR